jgi:hypothetical protein
MLIEFLFEKFPNFEDVNETAIGDLQVIQNTIDLSIMKIRELKWGFPTLPLDTNDL